jgi:hypothetical protein
VRFEGLNHARRQASDVFWRFVPISIVVAISSYVLGSQIVRPQHRMIKAGVLLLALAILSRFDMLYSIYFFILLFPFPSGVVLTSTNALLMTLIPLVWLVRSRATGAKLFARTDVDKWIAVFLLAHVVSLFNVETTEALTFGIKLIWRQLTVVAFFYLIVTFVDDESKLERTTKMLAIAGALVAFTGILELFAPGVSVIPGWIETQAPRGVGMLGYRIQGLRIRGTVGWDLLSDFCGLTLFLMVTHFFRGKNPIEKVFWLGVSIITFAALLGTATRGGVISLGVACIYSLWVFRERLNLVKSVVLISVVVVAFASMQFILDKYTLAASVTGRIMGTKFQGVVPESRAGIWEAAFKRSLDHIFIGHGPSYDTGTGLVRIFWPHNGYLFYLYTLGLFGLSTFLIIAYRLFRISLRYAHPLASGSYLGVALSIFSAQLVMFLVGQLRTDYQRTHDYIYPYLAWMLFGLIAAAGNILKKRELEARASAPSPAHPRTALPGTGTQSGTGAFGGEAGARESGDGGSPVRRSPA